MHLAATTSRCQTVFNFSAISSCQLPVSWFGCQFLKYTLIFDTKRFAPGSGPPFSKTALRSRSISRLLFSAMIFVGNCHRHVHSQLGIHAWHTLYRFLFVRGSNARKHFPHVCDVLNSSTKRTVTFPNFLKLFTNFLVPGHRSRLFMPIGEFGAILADPMNASVDFPCVNLRAISSLARFSWMYLSRPSFMNFREQ